MSESLSSTPRWWKEGVCYQVWPQSFKDSNSDGIGDIAGVISKLDYLKDLGVDYIWLSPMYASPRRDYGYDISDYEAVDPKFGTLQDMDDLIAGLRSRGMRLILDLVVNHTSSEHKWYKQSAQSRDNDFSNYYIWRDPKVINGKKQPPNNWRALFGGSAWKYVDARDQYYLHLFDETMPDLNWEDPLVRKAIFRSAIEFWLARGVAGFRVDVVNLYSKDTSFPDAPVQDARDEYHMIPTKHFFNGPGMHTWLQEQRNEALSKYGDDVVLVGELAASDDDHTRQYLSPTTRELDMVFDFDIFIAGGTSWEVPLPELEDNRCLRELRKALMKPQGFISKLGFWATTFFENHDQPRSVSNFGSPKAPFHKSSSKLLALLLAAMSGTLFVYQGQEIGMVNIPADWDVSDLRDPFGIRYLEDESAKYADDAVLKKKVREVFDRNNRDNARTPVQWSADEPYAGFSDARPWIRVNESFRTGINVQQQLGDPESVLEFWRRVIRFRKEHAETMIYGHTEFIDNDNEHVLSVIKHGKGSDGSDKAKLLVVLNYSDYVINFPSLSQSDLQGLSPGNFLFGTKSDRNHREVLQPWEGRIFELSNAA